MRLGRKEVGIGHPTYFIADIASNHDGEFERAKQLIRLAAEAGADAVKFQNFKAETIVSDYGFKQLGKKSHHSGWNDSIFETFKKYSIPLGWAPLLRHVADSVGVDYITTPYDPDMLHYLSSWVCAWKIGSGDITYDSLIKRISGYDKPILLSTGASTEDEVWHALRFINNHDVVLMQCNTNYTGDPGNFNFVNLKVLVNWWGGGILGLSDHTPGHSVVLGAVALAASVIEKHFTDDNTRAGPDHKFSMNPVSWRTMIDRTRELEAALSGNGIKKIEENEKETVVLQRRAIRAKQNIAKGEKFSKDNLECLRPCPEDALSPTFLSEVLGENSLRDMELGDYIRKDEV